MAEQIMNESSRSQQNNERIISPTLIRSNEGFKTFLLVLVLV